MQELSTAVEKASGSLQGVVRAPCLAHVIQLALNKLIHRLRIQAKNDKVITTWAERPEDREKHTEYSDDKGVPYTLKKVRIHSSHPLSVFVLIFVTISTDTKHCDLD